MSFESLVANAPVRPLDELITGERTLVVAPHPDDESLGCGGVIARLRQQGRSVHVLFVSDGSMSHPNSKKYPAATRRDLREQEAQDALAVLGVSSSEVTFLRLPDTQVPTRSSADFERATNLIHSHLQQTAPHTILVPWRRDPHGDHRATWHLLRAAVDRTVHPVRWVEYPIWVWETTDPEDLPTPADGTWYKVDVTSVVSRKQRAIAAHVSQTTPLIDDDPEGFTLSEAMISHFTQPYEYFLVP